VPWALIFGAVGIFIWGLDISEWFIPATSLVLSVSFLVGPVPSQMMAGCMYALVTRPFDIGDRIRLARPGFKVGHNSPLHEMVVKQQDLMHTYLLTQTGETMAIENHILRNLLVTNITRSGPVTLKLRIQLPIMTRPAKITELIDAIGAYARSCPSDWIGIEMHIDEIHMASCYLELEIWATSAIPAHELAHLGACKSRLLMFVHAYMQTAKIEYLTAREYIPENNDTNDP